MSNYYSMEIRAPRGLRGLMSKLPECKLSLEAYKSGYNGKVILRAKNDNEFELSMDASDTEIIFGSGEIFSGQELAIEALESLSAILRESSYPHVIWVDDENGCLVKELKYDYQPTII